MGRKILFITTDQMRYDAFGCNGGTVARTPVVDALAAQGTTYRRCSPQSVVCMPSRSTIITGQHVSTHGVWMNGVALPGDAPSVAAVLQDAGYKTALLGKAHFEPFFDPFGKFPENAMARLGTHGPHRGFDHMELATHGPNGNLHYAQWIRQNHPEAAQWFFPVLDAQFDVNGTGGGDTGAPQAHWNEVPREWYHTEWIADRTIDWLDSLNDDADWFCWVSFPDPHHPWDPPQSERGRVDWRDLDLPVGYIADRAKREAVLDGKPRHYRHWYDGDLIGNYEAPPRWIPNTLTDDQVREVNALVHVENELIDEAIGRIMKRVSARGWDGDTDVLVTTDHGEFQGDFGLLFKGPYHLDALTRIPLIWRPAPSAAVVVAPEVTAPVGLVDLAPTFCAIAGVDAKSWMEGKRLPVNDAEATTLGHVHVLTEWDSSIFGIAMHVRTITRDGFVCSAYLPGTVHDGSEGELYDLASDPLQHVNLWSDVSRRSVRDDLLSDLWDSLPEQNLPLRAVEAPV
jgi:arylsulfatase A-like enzyme